jgi:YHS domain-containing protein
MGTLLIVLVRVLVLLAAIWLICGLVRTLITAWSSRSASLPPPRKLERDPVCGIYIVAESALKTSLDNEQQFFCSTECRDKYLRSRPG